MAIANDEKTAVSGRKTDNATTDAGADEPRILKFPAGKVKCKERLGGLLRHYYRAAA